MRPVYFKFLIACTFFIIFACSQENNIKKQQFIQNVEPKYADSEYITLEELHSIDVNVFDEYYIYQVNDMDVDSDTNLYILDYYESTVTVFDKSGKYLRTMCGKGEGPNELWNPKSISINDNKMHIFQHNRGMKILDLNGKYVDFIRPKITNYEIFKAFDNFYLSSYERLDENVITLACGIDRHTKKLEFKNNIVNVKFNSRDYMDFRPSYYIAVDSKNCIYYPENPNEYIINKYDIDGNLLLSFGREYKRVPFSDTMNEIHKKWLAGISPNRRIPLAKYPSVVRYIMIDDNDYIWVVAGENSFNSYSIFSYIFPSTIDIFDEEGKFLYTFKSPYIIFKSFIKYGRLYSYPVGEDMLIRIFKIRYNY